MKNPILLIVFSLMILSCQDTQSVDVSPGLTGEWEWISTTFVRRGIPNPTVITPETAGVEMTINFTSDSTVSVRHNGTEVALLNYQLRELGGKSLLITYPGQAQENAPFLEEGVVSIEGDTLEIVGNYNDAGGNQVFVRP
jgi:hypothetical protein